MTPELVGRTGLARILEVSENSARSIEARGEIAPETFVNGRPLFSVQKARQLHAVREARRTENRA